MKPEILVYQDANKAETKKLILFVLKSIGYDYSLKLDYDLENPDHYYSGVGQIFYILKVKDQVVGTIGVRKIDTETAEIKRLYVAPNFQGKGLGGILLDKALEFCKQSDYKKIVLDTSQRMLSARALYIKRGFEETSHVGETLYMEKYLE